jgi:hypothetical protein
VYEAFQFEVKEAGYDSTIGKRNFVEYLMKLYPNINKARYLQNETTVTVYKGIVLKEVSTELPHKFSNLGDIKAFLLPKFIVVTDNEKQLTCDVDTNVIINGNSVFKKVTFYKDQKWSLEVSGKKVNLEDVFISSKFEFCKESVESVCQSVLLLRLCEAETVSGSVVVSRYHTVENFKVNDKQERKIRSVMCNTVVSVNSLSNVCRKCQKMTFGQAKSETNKENIKSTESERAIPKDKAKTVTKDDIKNLIPNATDEMLELLLSQVQNTSRNPQGRRWSQAILNVALQWYCRSPHSYEAFRSTKSLVLPSPSTLVLYKNRVKQQVGFDDDVFRWMFQEAKRRNITEEGWTGGIILDEMTIQSDIQISKTGDLVELSGFVETGDEGNICHVIRTGKNDETIGTHALQLIFLGISGFRFPFAHFITDGIQAPELHTLFWQAVDKLQTFGFNAVYVSMDGAQSNRTFMKYNLGQNSKTFISPSPCSLGHMIFIMDVSHVIKKIRNNTIKSGIQKGATRLLTLPSQYTIQWQMFTDCFLWDKQNAFQLHKKLTNEHLFPSTQSKMRNKLAEDILDSEMLHMMQVYQIHLGEKGSVLTGAIEFLQNTSKLIDIFHSRKPVKSMADERLIELQTINDWFLKWESSPYLTSKHLMSAQCHEDIHSCIVGFLKLCELLLHKKDCSIFITPALINSDLVENTFNQVRSTYNGANTNPNALQYKRTLNNIVLGQKTVSIKANASKSHDGAMLFECSPRQTTSKGKRVGCNRDQKLIKVIRC